MSTSSQDSEIKSGRLFIGTRSSVRSYLRTLNETHYVYILRRPDGRPFYVGKGTGDRLFHHCNEARHAEKSHKLNVIRSIADVGAGLIYEIDSVYTVAQDAYRRESALIRLFKRVHEGGCLTNGTAGGRGGSDPSPESREKRRQTLGGVPEDDADQAILNRFVLSLAAQFGVSPPKSLFIKPERKFKAKSTKRFPTSRREATLRPALALVASALKNRLTVGAGSRIPRKLPVDGISAIIENGASCDIATSNMATVVAATIPSCECYMLDRKQADRIARFFGAEKLRMAGVLL
ncbi:GIY-YIG nuclease family protein [Bradyrhizobium pachyrhizi]|uniref:GIY-YIG nuclease family protein n=1 Tax=Bradyrhizobium pachyrhizi TaxID=280333 RepID=UPI000AE80287|nr:GIY-YIG nuclease family protein [Bradyrhizobium pachyrhizi]